MHLDGDELYIKGWENEERGNFEKAIFYYTLSGDSGNPMALYKTGVIYEKHYDEYEEAMEWYRKAAEQNNPNAMLALAHWHENGVRVAVDAEKAIALCEEAASCGNIIACNKLFRIYAEGKLVKRDEAKAAYWLHEMAKGGNKFAMVLLGDSYLKGKCGLKKDFKKALHWHEKASYKHPVNDKLADLYFFGNQFMSDDFCWKYNIQTRKYFLSDKIATLIEQELFDHQNEFQNIPLAVYLYQKLSRQYTDYAMGKLSFLYEMGFYLKKDFEKSNYWHNQSRERDKMLFGIIDES